MSHVKGAPVMFMAEDELKALQDDAKARSKAAQTPDQVWRSLALHAPRTMATAKRHGDVNKLVSFVCVLQRRIDVANEALAASERSLQRQVGEYIELKALVVELARNFGRNKNYPHSFPEELIEELMKVSRPLVVEQGTRELREAGSKEVVAGIDWAAGQNPGMTKDQEDYQMRLQAQTEAYRQGMVSRDTFAQEIMGEFQDSHPDHEKHPPNIIKDRNKKWEY
jgi:hypothetical protein